MLGPLITTTPADFKVPPHPLDLSEMNLIHTISQKKACFYLEYFPHSLEVVPVGFASLHSKLVILWMIG
jgi:hypothetical protein